jgi:hypothetical protein
MAEPWSSVLRMPWDEIVANVYEGQSIEADDGAGAQIKALDALAAALTGGSNG